MESWQIYMKEKLKMAIFDEKTKLEKFYNTLFSDEELIHEYIWGNILEKECRNVKT